MEWDELRYFLAAHRARSFASAGRLLGVDASTVSRRVLRLENQLSSVLFRRTGDGLDLTLAGRAILEAAESMEEQARQVLSAARGLVEDEGGRIRLATTETFATLVLVEALADFRKAHPGVLIELHTSDEVVDLGREGVDMAIRFGASGAGMPVVPSASSILGSRLGTLKVGLYASDEYCRRHSPPKSLAELGSHEILLPPIGAKHFPGLSWMEANLPEAAPIAFRCDRVSSLAQAAAAGMGIAPIPSVFARVHGLRRVLPKLIIDSRDCWLMVPRELRRVPSIRLLRSYLVAFGKELWAAE